MLETTRTPPVSGRRTRARPAPPTAPLPRAARRWAPVSARGGTLGPTGESAVLAWLERTKRILVLVPAPCAATTRTQQPSRQHRRTRACHARCIQPLSPAVTVLLAATVRWGIYRQGTTLRASSASPGSTTVKAIATCARSARGGHTQPTTEVTL
jgi:hypothetical protein